MANFPDSYRDPLYDQLDAANEEKLGLPVGLLSSIRTAGEKSNHSQVSSAGAATAYQIIPATRDAAIKKFGIDPMLSPQNASEVAGRLLKDSLKRNKGDASAAVGEYIGGTDRSNWGKVTNAYVNRVMTKQTAVKRDALSDGFAQFMAANPAIPEARQQSSTPPAEQKPDALSAGFGEWLKTGGKNPYDEIPGQMGADGVVAPRMPQPVAAPDPTLVEKIIGGGETALTLATGATTGAVGMLAGGAAGLAGVLSGGRIGTTDGVENGMQHGAEALTYSPRTEAGRDYAGAAGEALASTIPMIPFANEIGAAAKSAGGAARIASNAAQAVGEGAVNKIRQAAPEISSRVDRILRRNPEQPTPTPGTQGSGGSAGTDIATIRQANAADLPVPVKLTEGQATRDFNQLRFENETAKTADGAAIRERYADQNKAIQDNFEAWVDQTGKTTGDVIETGKALDKVLTSELRRDKAEVRTKYTEAEKSPEALAAIDPGEMVSIGQGANAIQNSVIGYLNSKPSKLATTALTDHAKSYAVKLGLAEEAADGSLIPKPTDVKTMEALRKEISQATGYDPISKRDSTILKGIIDAQTEPVAGPLYREARRARELHARKWENRSIVSDLVSNKRGTDDRKVAIGDVFDHVILNGDRSELSHMRSILHKAGEDGKQVWRELQGETVEWVKSEALKNVATDQRGQRIVSPAQLEKAIMKLDKKGKLDFIFGKQGAQQMRDITDLTKVVFTTPPGTVNTSNTAGVLMAALTEAGITGSITGLPVPVLSVLRLISNQVKHRKLLKKIDFALNNRNRPRPPAVP